MAEGLIHRLIGKFSAANSGPPRVLVGAFGKHPAHNEHIEDLNGQHRLSDVFDRLYTHGIRAAVDKGVWQQLREEGTLLPFNHSIIWRMPDQIVVGRIWASHDNLYRDRYPMAVVAVCPHATLSFALLQILPLMVALEKTCIAAKTLNEVRQAVQRARGRMPAIPAGTPPTLNETDLESATAYLCRREELGPDCQGLVNVMYQVDREMGSFLPGSDASIDASRPIHLRVPCCGNTQAESAAAWLRLIGGSLSPAAPVLMLIPGDHSDWIDLLVGKPTEADFFYARTSTQTTPRTTDIPYTIPPEFSDAAHSKINIATDSHSADEPILEIAAVEPEIKSEYSKPTASTGKKKNFVTTALIACISLAMIIVAAGLWHQHHKLAAADKMSDAANHSGIASDSSAVPNGVSLTSSEPKKSIDNPKPDLGPDPRENSDRHSLLTSVHTDLASIDAGPAKTDLQNQYDLAAEMLATTQPWDGTHAADAQANCDRFDKTIVTVKQQVSQALADQAQGPGVARDKYLADLRQQTGPFALPEFNHGWRHQRDVYLAANPQASIAQMKLAITAIGDSITWIETDHDLSSSPDLTWEGNAKWLPALRKAVTDVAASKREAAILNAISAECPPVSSTTAPVAGTQPVSSLPSVIAYRQLKADAHRIGSDWLLVDQLLDAGAPLEAIIPQTPGGEVSIRKVSTSWQNNPLFTDISVRAALAPVRDKLLSVSHVAAMNRDDLVQTISTDSTSNPVRLAAWRRLGEPAMRWPADPSEWSVERHAKDKLLSLQADQRAIHSRDPQNWRTQLSDSIMLEITDGETHRWIAFASDLPADPANADARLAIAMAQKDNCNIDLATLPAPVRFNLALASLHSTIAADTTTPDDAKLRAGMQTFCDTTAKLGVADNAVAAIDTVLKSPGDIATATDGPGAAGLTRKEVGTDEVDYRLPHSNSHDLLRFIRVGPIDGPSRFVCTSELSVGQFMEAVTAFGQWKEVEPLVPVGPMSDGRLSPCVWTWKSGRMQVADSWLPPHASAGVLETPTIQTDYAAELIAPNGDLKPENGNDPLPTEDQPIQFISPHAAVYVAALLGCRIPTADDWRAALKSDTDASASRPTTQPDSSDAAVQDNVRDKTWNLQQKYIQRMQSLHGVDATSWPDFGIFWPAGSNSELQAAKAKPVLAVSDGVLWFRKIGLQSLPGHRFSDLVGNVAEYVTQDAPAGEVWPKVSSGPIAHDFVDAHLDWFKVIGGSALSAPELAVDQPLPIDHDSALGGFSDVGFRLAFTSSQIPLRQRLAAGLADIHFASAK